MSFDPRSLDRRRFLRTTAIGGLAVGLAGCLDGDEAASNDNVVLPPPEGYDEGVAEETMTLTYGDEVPELTAPDPIRDVDVTTTDFVGDRHTLYTFVFTRCDEACPGLMAALRYVQEDSIEEGYEDEICLCNVTFDPEYDTAAVLEEYERDHGVDQDVGNFYSLRPETPEDAESFVTDGFGVMFEPEEHDGHGEDGHDEDGHDDHGDDHGTGDHEGDDHGTGDHDDGHEHPHYAHTNLVLLVNRDGYVERAFTPDVPTPTDVIEDVRTVVEEW